MDTKIKFIKNDRIAKLSLKNLNQGLKCTGKIFLPVHEIMTNIVPVREIMINIVPVHEIIKHIITV